MNGPAERQRPPRLPRRGAGAELHQGRREARRFAVGAQPHHPRPRGAARPPAADPHHAQRRADRGRRTAAPDRRAALRRDRRRAGGAERASREARRHDPHHGRRACGRSGPLARPGDASAALSRHQGRDHRRLRPDRHRRGALRRRRPARRAGGEGHDRRAHRPGHAHGGRRSAFILRETDGPEEAAGPDGPRLHQSALADLRRTLRLGIREARARAEGAGRRAAGVQQHRPETERGTGRAAASPICRRIVVQHAPRRRTARSGCSTTGVRPFQAITSITRAAANPRRPSPCWSTRCATEAERSRSGLTCRTARR